MTTIFRPDLTDEFQTIRVVDLLRSKAVRNQKGRVTLTGTTILIDCQPRRQESA